ncbi:MAG: peptidase [Ruminococcaceae bacterium]|nr:peptidase [Oscillospiraceae bacterium]
MHFKKIIVALLVISLMVVFMGTSVSNAAEVESAYLENHSTIREKVLCTATINDNFTENEIIVVIQPNWNEKVYNADDFSDIGCLAVRELAGATDTHTLSRILLLTISDGTKTKVLEAIQNLEQRNDIYSAEPNYIEEVYVDCGYDELPALEPNDNKYENGDQWAIEKIGLPYAWNITTGSSSVMVGVIDTGIDVTHSDLSNRVNTELSRCFTDAYSTGLADSHGHGTHVAGIIGAQGNNEIGVSGTCWNVQLVSLRVANADNSLNVAAVIDAIYYADEEGIPILNYSGGGTQLSEAAIARRVAISNYFGLFVCAAGNNGTNNDITPFYPSNHGLPNLISVGASTEFDTVASFSNYGYETVIIFAPGDNIWSTLPGNRYASWDGTSMAAPYVAGVAALLKSLDSNITTKQIIHHIVHFADTQSAFSGKCVTGGRLDAYWALATHTYSYTETDSTSHSGSCSCGATKVEPHTWRDIGGLTMCVDCGLIIQ